MSALKNRPGTTVVGEAESGEQAIEAVQRLGPDAVLMDIKLPGMSGIEATREIRRRFPDVRVIGISVQTDEATERSMRKAGAEGLVPKSGELDTLVDMLRGPEQG